MYYMFNEATKFNSQICNWNLDEKVTTEMFTGSLCSVATCKTCDNWDKLAWVWGRIIQLYIYITEMFTGSLCSVLSCITCSQWSCGNFKFVWFCIVY